MKKNNQTDELAQSLTGISRIAVLRADVDNLGHAFVSGFDRDDCGRNMLHSHEQHHFQDNFLSSLSIT